MISTGNQPVIRSDVADVVEPFNPDTPDISPFIQSLNEGDTANLFCLSGESSPLAEISWQVRFTTNETSGYGIVYDKEFTYNHYNLCRNSWRNYIRIKINILMKWIPPSCCVP